MFELWTGYNLKQNTVIFDTFFSLFILVIYTLVFGFLSCKFDSFGFLGALYSVLIIYVFFTHVRSLLAGIDVDLKYICILKILINISFIVAFTISGGDESLFWPPDAYNMHLPNTLSFLNAINGDQDFFWINPNNPFHKTYFSNMYVGLWFKVFQVSPVVSALASLLLTVFTVILIYKTALQLFKNSKLASISALLYVLAPTVTYYSIQFYKEFFVQFCVALFVYFVIQKNCRFYLLIIPLFFLFLERFYLCFMLLVPVIIFVMEKYKSIKLKLFWAFFSLVAIWYLKNYYYSNLSADNLIKILNEARDYRNNIPGITPQDNYLIGMIRIIFTPFFTLSKVKNYQSINSLLTYGSFLHQMIMLLFVIGIYKLRKRKITLINISFVLFVMLFGYIEPFSGRVRDSFYPIITIFASYGLLTVLKYERVRKLFKISL